LTAFANDAERTAQDISTIADALRDEMHESVARICRPALLELTRMHKGTRISIVRSPRMPTAIICVPALMSDDFHAESDLVKWLGHSGQDRKDRARLLELVMTIVTSVAVIDGCGLIPTTFVLENEADYEGEDEDRTILDLASEGPDPDTSGNGLSMITMKAHNDTLVRISDSSLAYPDAIRIGAGEGSALVTRPQVASLMPGLLRFLRTGSISKPKSA
jgi:hypothetical protein